MPNQGTKLASQHQNHKLFTKNQLRPDSLITSPMKPKFHLLNFKTKLSKPTSLHELVGSLFYMSETTTAVITLLKHLVILTQEAYAALRTLFYLMNIIKKGLAFLVSTDSHHDQYMV